MEIYLSDYMKTTSTEAASKMPPRLAVIIPCYNEEDILAETHDVVVKYLRQLINAGKTDRESFICFVDDGSNDKTWNLIEGFTGDGMVRGIKLSSNFGHQNALLAGLMTMKDSADCFVTMDADLQDDASVIDLMINKYLEGNMIVYGVRDNRSSDSFLKRSSAGIFYRLMNRMGVRTVYNHADFRLADRRVVDCLEGYREVNLFLRGIFPLMGFRSDQVSYIRKSRTGGRSKYPLRKMAGFAWQGITSFNTSLLRIVTVTGILMFILALVTAIWALITYFSGRSIQGWTSILLIISAFSGINMISLGLIGEYVGKIYLEVKQRPRYHIEKMKL